ncbi:MAG TPA: nitroreductase [Candidatus Nitrosotalea sp.]|nr:nitroreductase [Candidatus Nitrosotalea sp.]
MTASDNQTDTATKTAVFGTKHDISWLTERRSVAVRRMGAPGPSAAELTQILSAALAAPDHGALRPWRVVRCSEQGKARLAELFIASKLRLKPDATETELGRERDKAMKPPVLMAMLATPKPAKGEITEAEQFASAGAAMQSILLVAFGLGYGAIILSGSRCADPAVRQAFGLSERDHLLGFISIGTVMDTPIPAPRPKLEEMVAVYDGADLPR